jgi:SAM-dependent methyltransferase
MSAVLTDVNYWPDTKCAKAFWGQHELPPYRRLLAATVAWLDPRPGECWLDLGCGGGQLSRALWVKSRGTLRELIGLDVAAANERAYRRLNELLRVSSFGQLRFVVGDMAVGLPSWGEGHFDGVVSGLAIQYVASYSQALGRWTTEAYDRLLAEVHRVLRPGGVFVFSVNVPEPSWALVALRSVFGFFVARNPLHYLKNSMRMFSYGAWLKREARRGRFHYLPGEVVEAKLTAAGFRAIERQLSFANQAYVFRCRK